MFDSKVESLQEAVNRKLKEKELNQTSLVFEGITSKTMVSRICSGKKKSITESVAKVLSDVLGGDIEYWMGLKSDFEEEVEGDSIERFIRANCIVIGEGKSRITIPTKAMQPIALSELMRLANEPAPQNCDEENAEDDMNGPEEPIP